MKGALVTFIAKIEGVVKEKFVGASPQTPTFFAPPPIKIPGGATVIDVTYLSTLILVTNTDKLLVHAF